MGLHIIRPEQRVIMIPGIGIAVRGALASEEANWWEVSGKTCVAAYQPKGAASYAASLVNLANPGTYDATAPGTAPDWASGTGWDFSVSNSYLSSGAAPTGGWSMFAAFDSGLDAVNLIMGCRVGANNQDFTLLLGDYGDTHRACNGSGYIQGSDRIQEGVYGVAGTLAFLNGVQESGTTAGTASNALPIFLGANNNNGSLHLKFSGNMKAAVIYSDTLTPAEAIALETVMATL